MGFPLALQAEGFFSSLLLGIVLALLYDLLRALRVHRGAARALTGVLDALYCLLFSLLVFLFSLRVGGGELRLYMIAAALAGALFYFLLAARLLRPLWDFWAEVVFSLCALAAAPLRALKRAYGKLAKLCKRYFLFSRNRLIINAYGRGAMRAQRARIAGREKKEGQRMAKVKEAKKRTSFLTMLVIAVLIVLVGVQLIHLRAQIETAQAEQAALQSKLDAAKQENDALSSALEKADDPEFLQELARDQLGYVTPGEKSFYDVSN